MGKFEKCLKNNSNFVYGMKIIKITFDDYTK